MVRMAVCDRDETTLRLLRERAAVCCQEGGLQWEGTENLSDLVSRFQEDPGAFQVVFFSLDEEGRPDNMPDLLEELYRLRTLAPAVKLILLSEEPGEPLQELYPASVSLFGVIRKPVDPVILERYLRKILREENGTDGGVLLVRNRGSVQAIHHQDILFLESEGHIIIIQTKDGSCRCYGRLDKFLEELPDYFVQSHKSYVVNMREIRSIERSWLEMEQGMRLPISKNRYRDTKSRFIRFMEGLGGTAPIV